MAIPAGGSASNNSCLEDLNVVRLMKDCEWARDIADAAWSELVRQLKYKSEWYGRQCVQIDRYFPSSKLHRKCGFIYQDLSLDEREWTCPRCGEVLDRDLNAADNILVEGMRVLSGYGMRSDNKQKPEEASSLEESMSREAPTSLA